MYLSTGTPAHRWRKAALAALAAAAVFAAIAVALWPRAEEVGAAGTPSMSFNVKTPAALCDHPSKPTKCTMPIGTKFGLSVAANTIPADGYTGFDTQIYFDGLKYNPAPSPEDEVTWPDSAGAARAPTSSSSVTHGAQSGGQTPRPRSFHTGNLLELSLTCTQTGTSTLLLISAASGNVHGAKYYSDLEERPVKFISQDNVPELGVQDIADTLDINCQDLPTFTPEPTRTPTPTNTVGPTPSGPAQVSLAMEGGSCEPAVDPTKCTIQIGQPFSLSIVVKNRIEPGYIAVATQLFTDGLVYSPAISPTSEFLWPDCGLAVRSIEPIALLHGCVTSLGPPFPVSTFKGGILKLAMACPAQPGVAEVALGAYAPDNPNGTSLIDPSSHDVAPLTFGERSYELQIGKRNVGLADTLQINCVLPPTATPTPTPIDVPQMQKLPALQNLFLTRQGTKIPPVQCAGAQGGDDGAVLVEQLSIPIGGLDPKDPGQPRRLGGFSFEVQFNGNQVCVELKEGPAWQTDPAQVCTIEDAVTKPTLQNKATIHCVTLGKATTVDTNTPEGRVLAVIRVKPQPGLYSEMKANQDNGHAVLVRNEKCKLTDLQGIAIAVFSCDDASVTIRYLEGDVEPDCQVNVLDTQQIAFRWGSQKGQLSYNDRFNLEPSGHNSAQSDNDIDVNDLQFVFGRFGSACPGLGTPHPLQPPVNASG